MTVGLSGHESASLSVCVFRMTGIDGGSGESEVTVNC